MAGNGSPDVQMLAPPAVTAIKQQVAHNADHKASPMIRSLTDDMREEREDLKEAAEQTLNVIADIDLDSRVKWVSPSWRQVVGTPPESVEGRLISDLLVTHKDVFHNAIESMKEDDSRSRFIRFAVRLGPESVLRHSPEKRPVEGAETETSQGEKHVDKAEIQSTADEDRDYDILNMEAQGIMVFNRSADGKGHTMWMLRPFNEPREVTIDLPPLLVESLGVGAEVLANYLTSLAEAAANEPDHSKHPTPNPVLCRICERQITPWWFEKHSELCLQEHRAEMDVQIAQENLNEHRHAIVKVLDALEARQNRHSMGDSGSPIPGPQPEYKGLPIGPSPGSSGPSSGNVSSASSVAGTPPRSREHSLSSVGHGRGRSTFAVRRPLARIVELILDLCDTALEISTPTIKETRTDNDDFRTLSPQSESRISQVLQWQSPSSNTLDQEQGLAALAADTELAAKAKVDAVIRHRKIVEYAERIRIEYMVLVDECITAALSKAERIAAGQLTDSSSCSSDEEVETTGEVANLAHSTSQEQALPSASALTMSIRNSQNRFGQAQSDSRWSSQAVSTASNSPMECPTPRSHRSVAVILGTSQSSRRNLLSESDAGETSDSSIPSSIIPGALRTESPSSERSLERKRRSLVLTGLSSSPRRQLSPARASVPHSPLRIPKPRLSIGAESLPSPVPSPSASTNEIPHHYHIHHRRQSSTASSDAARPPPSPRLSSVSQPQPRPAPPSIKDFEIIKPISKGAFGSVYLSKKKTTGEYFAIKVLKKADMIAKNQVTNVKAERAIMMWQGESDFVAKLYWTFSSKDYLYLVMEYLNGGDCASLVKVLGELPEDWAKSYIAEVVLGVEHLHNRGIVHRDLKPDNLLIDQKGHLKLTDFGLSRMGLVGRQKRMLKSHNNEPAPDLLKQGPFPRATSISSSRSASFDYQGSPGSTPLIAPEIAGSYNQPTYFNLNYSGLSRQNSRRASDYRSESGASDSFNGPYRTFSLNEGSETPAPLPLLLSNSAAEEEGQSEAGESPHLYPLQRTFSNQSASVPPPQQQQQQPMIPPLMALFDPEDHSRRFVGTPDYLAPETINGVGQDEMSDWWSLGCIMFEFLFGYPPFNAATPDEVFDNILHRRINWPDSPEEIVSLEAIDLMNKLMTINPQERLGANVDEKFPNGGAEIRSHPWFADINFDTLLEDKAQFVPNPENPEDTDYFDGRGATLQAFTEEIEDQQSTPPHPATTGSYPDRPHDALFKVRSQVNAIKRPLMPLHIPPHVRDSRSRRLSEPVIADDFGNFTFKNLPILEKANKDVIQKLRQEALQAQQRQSSSAPPAPPVSSGPSLEGSPLPGSLHRTVSQNKGNNRPSSPSGLSQANSSPSRPSQPSSPLLVQFSTGQNHERRKTSGSSSAANSLQSSGSTQPANGDQSRVSNIRLGSTAPSPVRTGRAAPNSPDKTPSGKGPQGGALPTRARSQTIGSQDGEFSSSLPKDSFVPGHYKRRSQLVDISPSSSDNEDPRTKALLKVQRRRQSSRRLSQINLPEGPFFRPLDVLICEDHPVSRIVMERLFEKLRCRTITAVNGAEAMRYALSEVQFDIIMTEVKIPQVNGADFARMVRETRSVNRHTPIIAVTGYLKDLPETHHFDALIEKPPTLSKLTEALCKFCQWKPPPKDNDSPQPPPVPGTSALRYPVPRADDSPVSASSSGFTHLPPSLYPGSSREDSIGSGSFGDADSIKAEDAPVVISNPTDDWPHSHTGLGLSEDVPAAREASESKQDSNIVPFPPLLDASSSAPSSLGTSSLLSLRKQRSSEAVRAKRESREKKRYECAESGDDEDEELGDVQVRARSPRPRGQRPGSKLGVEMMRTNSRGSVVCEDLISPEIDELVENANTSSGDSHHESELSKSPSGRTGLEERFQELHIPEEAVAPTEGETTPQPILSSVSQSRSITDSSQKPVSRDDQQDVSESASRSPTGDSGSNSSKKGQITPPVLFSRGTSSDLTSASLAMPAITMSLSSPVDSTFGADAADSNVTPRALPSPPPL
ncbi:rim15, signal transduction response regulator [Monascus purpureus]|uniref:non-specific serine/threonine protein kinase n=1 Tax=Monascus purpureus TaxID=5098 RepID=A0A507QUB2_MONPU|nr:rim15, signal transduction response regulator [Monascus purpureus]BDD62588.1 hypothetical protein MAP00_007554 [Monascus purpureus]